MALGAGLAACDSGESSRAEWIGDLYLVGKPKPAKAGGVFTWFVQGEPPARLRARKYVDVLSLRGEPLYRLASDVRPRDSITRYPLSESYRPPTGTRPLQMRQRVHLPRDLEPGRYILRGTLVLTRSGVEPPTGTPATRLRVVAK